MSVASYECGGRHGHLVIIMTSEEYFAIAVDVFPVPNNPGPSAVVVAGMTAAVIAETTRLHREATQVYCTYHNVDQAIKKLIIEYFDDAYLNALSDEIVGYANCTSLQLLTHLLTYYAMIAPTELTKNYEHRNTPYDPNLPIETLFQQIQDARAFAVVDGQPDVDEKLEAIVNWDDASVHYRYITMDAQAQDKSFWQEHYKLMSGTIPEVVDTNKFDRPHQHRPQIVHMSYSDITRSSRSPLTQSQNNIQDGASVETTIASNVSRQETNDSGMNMITGLSLIKKQMEEIYNQRESFKMKQQRMEESIITVTSSVSKLSADILAVRIDMNIMSDKLEKNFNKIIALLAITQTPAMPSLPTRKVARGTNTSPVKHAASNKRPVEAFGGVVTQRKTQSPPASPSRKFNAETWANMYDEEAQEDYMHISVNILMEVDSAEADGNQ
jgi:hypothetical protein